MSQNTKYKNQWAKEKLDRIPVSVNKGEKEKITEHYKSKGYKSMNDYINALIKRDMAGGALNRAKPGIVRRFPPAEPGCRPPRMKTCMNGLTIHPSGR